LFFGLLLLVHYHLGSYQQFYPPNNSFPQKLPKEFRTPTKHYNQTKKTRTRYIERSEMYLVRSLLCSGIVRSVPLKSSADVISGPHFWSLFPKHPSRMSFRDPISGPSFRNTPPGCHFGTSFPDIRFWYPKFDPFGPLF